MKKTVYIAPKCKCIALMTDRFCDGLIVSKLQGTTDQPDLISIGDGGDNDDDAPGPAAKGSNVWDSWE
jgi:hypothetical protein